MELEEFLGQENINNFEKLLLVYLQFRSFKSYKDLEPIFKVSGVTIRKAIANLRKLELIDKYTPVKLSFRCKEIFTQENTECKESFTYKNDTCKENLTQCKEMFTSDSDRCKESFTSCKENFTSSEKKHSLSINTDLININRSIYIEEGKSSLTSFASTSRRNFTTNSNFVNDSGHENLNQIQNNLIPTEPAKTALAEIAKAPAKRKRVKNKFEPPTVEQVEIYMQQYVEMKKKKFPDLVLIDLAVNAEKYMNYYEGKGWNIRNWKNAAGNWLITEMGYIQMGSSAPKKLTLEEIEQTQGEQQNDINTITIENVDGTVTVEAAPAEETEQEKERRRAEEMNKFLKDHNYGHDRL